MKLRTKTVASLFALAFFILLTAPGRMSAQEPRTYHVTPDDLEP